MTWFKQKAWIGNTGPRALSAGQYQLHRMIKMFDKRIQQTVILQKSGDNSVCGFVYMIENTQAMGHDGGKIAALHLGIAEGGTGEPSLADPGISVALEERQIGRAHV